MAAAIRITSYLVPGVVYAAEKNGLVQYSGKSESTIAPTLSWGREYDSNCYKYASEHSEVKYGESTVHWWVLPSKVSIESDDSRSWREVLEQILSDICTSDVEAHRLKQSVNGVAAYANSASKRSGNHNPRSVASACIQRFNDREDYKEFVQHPDFEAYVQKRSEAFF